MNMAQYASPQKLTFVLKTALLASRPLLQLGLVGDISSATLPFGLAVNQNPKTIRPWLQPRSSEAWAGRCRCPTNAAHPNLDYDPTRLTAKPLTVTLEMSQAHK